jgi:hypothetical protein
MQVHEKTNLYNNLKEIVNQLDDAITELDLHDDDTIPYLIIFQ